MNEQTESPKPAWQPLPPIQRRIAGVLVEKAKTTPDQYPLSLNALTGGCNQKSNRDPQMNLQQHEVEEALEKLRAINAVGEVQGSGRVAKYRHYMKDWLGVDGKELAVMAELLLRGDQTIGELRGRANRMTQDEIPDVSALRPVLEELIEKRLLIPLTPAGRGQVVSHNLYSENELQQLRSKYGTPSAETFRQPAQSPPPAAPSPPPQDVSWTATSNAPAASTQPSPPPAAPTPSADDTQVATLRAEVEQLKEELARLKRDVEDLWSNIK